MFGSILQRMILWELTKVFVMSLVGITGILLMAGIIAEASQQGLGPTQILAAIPLLVPSTLPYTIPATTLFATCVVYGRLAADNELLAIKSAGINAVKIVRPGIILGLVMSSATMGLYYRVIPYTHHLLRAMVFNDAEELMYSLLRKHGEIKYSSFPYQIFVKGVRKKTLLSPIFKRKDAHGQIDYVAHASEAELQVLPSKGQVLFKMRHCFVTSENDSNGYLGEKDIPVDLPKDFGKQNQRRPRNLTWQEILEQRVELQQQLDDIQARISVGTSALLLAGAAADLPKHLEALKNEVSLTRQQMVALDVELQMRPAEPGLSVLHPRRLSGRHLVQPQRLPQRLHHLLFAHRFRLLSLDAVRHRHGQGRPIQHDSARLGRRRSRRTGRPDSVLALAAKLTPSSTKSETRNPKEISNQNI